MPKTKRKIQHTPGDWWSEEDVIQKAIYEDERKKLKLPPPKYKHISIHGTYPGGTFVAYCGCHKETEGNAQIIVNAIKTIKQRDALLAACKSARTRLARICAKGGTLQDFLDDGSLKEIARAMQKVRGAVEVGKPKMGKKQTGNKCRGCRHLINGKCDIKGLKRWQCILGKNKYSNGPPENNYVYG